MRKHFNLRRGGLFRAVAAGLSPSKSYAKAWGLYPAAVIYWAGFLMGDGLGSKQLESLNKRQGSIFKKPFETQSKAEGTKPYKPCSSRTETSKPSLQHIK